MLPGCYTNPQFLVLRCQACKRISHLMSLSSSTLFPPDLLDFLRTPSFFLSLDFTNHLTVSCWHFAVHDVSATPTSGSGRTLCQSPD